MGPGSVRRFDSCELKLAAHVVSNMLTAHVVSNMLTAPS